MLGLEGGLDRDLPLRLPQQPATLLRLPGHLEPGHLVWRGSAEVCAFGTIRPVQGVSVSVVGPADALVEGSMSVGGDEGLTGR